MRKTTVMAIYVVSLLLLAPLIMWLTNRSGKVGQSADRQPLNGLFNSANPSPTLQQRMSLGDKILVTADINPDKQAGVQAFAKEEFPEAVKKFEAALKVNRNDPETRIYWNNASAALTGNTIKLGASVPAGGNVNLAREILRGVAQYQDEVNKSGGIGGKRIQVQIANDDNDSNIAKQIAGEFVRDRDILAVVGHNSSETSIASAPIYQKGGLVMISPNSTARELSGIGSYIYRTTPTSRATADTLARYVTGAARKTKVAICYDSTSEASKSFQQDFEYVLSEYGGSITKTSCDFSAPNFNPIDIPSQATSDGADALLLVPSFQKLNPTISVIQANKGRLTLFGNQTMFVFETLKQGQVDSNGMVLSVPWHPDASPNSSYIKNAKSLWGAAGNWRTAMAYDAMQAIATGLKSGATRTQLQKTLSSAGFSAQGSTGLVQFSASGDRNMKGILIQVQPGKNSGTGYDFVPLKP